MWFFFFNYYHGVSTIQALCPVTDPRPLVYHFTLHDPTQTNTYICGLWIFPVTVPGSSWFPLTHTQRHKPSMGLRLSTELIASPVAGLDLLFPPGANFQATLVSLVSSLHLWLLHFTASKPLVLSPTNPTWYWQVCTHWYTSLHSILSSSKKQHPFLIRIYFICTCSNHTSQVAFSKITRTGVLVVVSFLVTSYFLHFSVAAVWIPLQTIAPFSVVPAPAGMTSWTAVISGCFCTYVFLCVITCTLTNLPAATPLY